MSSHKSLYIRDGAFWKLLNGQKKYELRLYRGTIEKLRPGEVVYMLNGSKNASNMCKIQSMHIYENFPKLLHALGCSSCLPGHTIISGMNYMDTIYSKEMQKKHKVVAIEFY
jgi:ASC-1-like (ASCH) protein